MDYYERYWKGNHEEEGIATSPPIWKEEELRRVIGVAEPYCQGHVLDLGCGEGTFTFHLNKLDKIKKITGTDISQIAISQAKKKYPGVEFITVAATTLPFPKESFDFIAMVELVEHILDIKQMLTEVNRVLKPGGYILVTTTDFNLLKKVIIATFFWEKYFYPTNPHIRFFTKQTLKESLNKTGFEIFKYKWNGSYAGIMPKGQIVLAKKIKTIL